MKKLALLLALVLTLGMLTACGGGSDNAGDSAEPSADAETLEGVGEGFGGELKVQVVKEGDDIVSVEVLSHEESYDDLAEVKEAIDTLPGAIAEANGTDGVDGVSGATYTSDAIFEAVNNALGQ